MKQNIVIRTLSQLGEAITLAPERHRAIALDGKDRARAGEPLGSLVALRNERVTGDALRDAIVLDTTHARDGVLDLAAALRAAEAPSSSKKRVRPGDLLVSRLRPYLRQIAFAHPAAMAPFRDRVVACSTEFYVLAPSAAGAASLAYLLPWLLGAKAQTLLAAGQEGGHHPRVPRETVLAMRVPNAIVARRAALSREVDAALETLYRATDAYARLLARC